MTAPAAERWFVTDHAYRALHEDYALSCCLAFDVKQEILARDFSPLQFFCCDSARSFLDVLYHIHNGRHGYSFGVRGDMFVYADVDQANPAHEKEWRAKIAATAELEQESEKCRAVKAKLVKGLLEKWNKAPKAPSEAGLDQDYTEDEARRYIDTIEVSGSCLPPIILGLIVGLDEEERQAALMLISGQAKVPVEVQRPVLVLVGVVNTAQSTVIGEGQGYKTAFNPLNRGVIIRPFVSNEKTHLLGDNWHADLPDDGISYKGTTEDFVAKCVGFVDQVNAEGYTPSEADGFKFLVWANAMDWILEQSPAVVKDKDETTIEGLPWKRFDKGYGTLEEKFGDLKFPMKVKVEQEKYAKEDNLDYEFFGLKNVIEMQEPRLRDAAVELKENGKMRKAQAAAEMWDAVAKAIKDFEAVVEEEK
ncbi:MAG: hypothetical protein Q9170_008098 [Blastenia crenularia]